MATADRSELTAMEAVRGAIERVLSGEADVAWLRAWYEHFCEPGLRCRYCHRTVDGSSICGPCFVLKNTIQRMPDVARQMVEETGELGQLVRLKGAVRELSKDMHVGSGRPCPTCVMMTQALGEPFGCEQKRESSSDRRAE